MTSPRNRLWLAVAWPFLLFVLLGSAGLAAWMQSLARHESVAVFRALARTNADFLRSARIPESGQMMGYLGRMLNMHACLVNASGEFRPALEHDLAPFAAALASLPELSPRRVGPRFEAIAAPVEGGVRLVLVRPAAPMLEFLRRRDTLLVLGTFCLLSIVLAGLVSRRLLQAERLALLGRLATGLAHEIHNPLSAIRLHAQLLESAEDAAAVAQAAPVLVEESGRIEALVNQWMFLARPEPPRTGALALAPLVAKLLRNYATTAAHAQVRMEAAIAPDLHVDADERRLAQVLSNLLLNAIQAMPQGGRVRVSAVREGGGARVVVSDTGPGFSPAALAHGRELFFSEKEGGMGVGLSVVAEIVEAHAGRLILANEAGQGAAVSLYLPGAELPPAARPMKAHLLIVEDEHAVASALGAAAQRLGHSAQLCSSGAQALAAARQAPFDLAIVDIGLPDRSGLRLLPELRAIQASLPAVIITAHGNLENAVASRQLDAAAYLVKPLDLSEVQQTMRDVLQTSRAETPPPPAPMPLLVGGAPAMQRCFVEIAQACGSEAPVLIAGPTGTGKTLAARVIHDHSSRGAGPFVTLHCSALPEPLLETELFGHEKNAFTGAGAAKTGHVERAAGGTLFLDEIADISPGVQARLLRIVEEKSFSRVGGREDLRVNLRLVTATHRNLREEVRAGRFREDLFYRLHVLEVNLPPLAERRADIPALAASLLAGFTPPRGWQISPEALALLQRHLWPGNVRELRNVLERSAAVAHGTVILPQNLPRELREAAESAPAAESAHELDRVLGDWLQEKLREGATYRQMHDEIEAKALKHLLAHFEGKPTVLARELRMNRVTLRRRQRGLPGVKE